MILKQNQKKAKIDIQENFKIHNRLQYISACGTGKTLVGFEVIKDILDSNTNQIIVLFFPSLALISQTYTAYLSYGLDIQNNDILFICSDESVYEEEKLPTSNYETEFKVTTLPDNITQFFQQTSQKNKIIFSTYHSSKILADNCNSEVDFALYDEAHKTATSSDSYFNYSLDDNNIKIHKRLFMTATPKHKKINSNKEEEEYQFTMDNSDMYGFVANKYTLREAIDDGVVAPYQIVIAVVAKEEIEKIRKNDTKNVKNNTELKREAKIVALNNAMKKFNINKGIVFAERIKKSKEYLDTFTKYNNNIFAKHIDANYNSKEIKNIFNQFDNSKKGLLFNAQILSEGIDIPAVELAAFMEKSTSSVNIAQRIGRATRIDPQNHEKIGYVFIPIFISEEENQENFKTSSELSEMLDVIQTMAEQDSDLYAELYKKRVYRNKLHSNLIKIVSFDKNLSIENFENKIEAIIVESVIPSWHENLELLKEYYSEFGKFPAYKAIYKNKNIGSWVGTQKAAYKKNELSQDRIDLLDSVDVSWRPERSGN